MAPLVLKIKGNKTFSPFSTLASEDDLSKTWRVCTKVKDQLENGSRLENLSWRLWFRQHLLNEKSQALAGGKRTPFRRLSLTTARRLSKLVPLKDLPAPVKVNKVTETAAAAPMLTDNVTAGNLAFQHDQYQIQQMAQQHASYYSEQTNFTLPQFTSDQNNGEIVELEDIFNAFNSDFNIPVNNNMDMADGWDFGIPSPTNPYYSPTQSVLTLQHPTATTCSDANQPQQQQQHQQDTRMMTFDDNLISPLQHTTSTTTSQSISPIPTDTDAAATAAAVVQAAMYVSSNSMPPPAPMTSSLRNKLIQQHQDGASGGMRFNSSGGGFNTNQQTPPMSASNSSSTIASNNSNAMAGLRQMSGILDDHNRHNQHFSEFAQQYSASAPSSPPLQHASLLHLYDMNATQQQPQPQQPKKKSDSCALGNSAAGNISSLPTSEGQSKPICTNCGATSTPLWRRSTEDELLCNACGLYQKLHNAPRPKTLKPHNARKEARDDEASQLVCSNCSTTTTPLWRRDDEGLPLCNACGLYLKLHHEKRPLSMKTDVIKKRQRYESTNTNPQQQQQSSSVSKKANKKAKGDNSSNAAITTTPNSPELSPTLMDNNNILSISSPDQLFNTGLDYSDFCQQQHQQQEQQTTFTVYQQQPNQLFDLNTTTINNDTSNNNNSTFY